MRYSAGRNNWERPEDAEGSELHVKCLGTIQLVLGGTSKGTDCGNRSVQRWDLKTDQNIVIESVTEILSCSPHIGRGRRRVRIGCCRPVFPNKHCWSVAF
jgi:hypothetical protein